VRKTQLLIMII